jgi:hypothetical protein
MNTLHHHDHHLSMTPKQRKFVSFIIALALSMILFNVFAISGAHAVPMAWGQPLPPQCTTRFEWKSPNTYPVHVYDAPGCAEPWLENLVEFWNWFKGQAQQPKQ